ncbi:hypothetical protein [uncultured Methanobrevibacter sp.]|uniref:hypothetical protein n=1 Tax=uncultured Methanobrevibacter sp. TaxID=253161 RepID=UPI003208F91F
MFKIEFNAKKTQYLNLMKLLIMVRDYKVKLDNTEAYELAKYELNLITYIQAMKNKKQLVNLDIKTKIILSYNNINPEKIYDKEIFSEELNLINEIKRFSKE